MNVDILPALKSEGRGFPAHGALGGYAARGLARSTPAGLRPALLSITAALGGVPRALPAATGDVAGRPGAIDEQAVVVPSAGRADDPPISLSYHFKPYTRLPKDLLI